MSRLRKIREDKRCQNCGHFVVDRFCPKCGQENTETRQSFYYLFVHFFEDFVHYDNKFWKTIIYLLFRPARLTKEYLSGKREKFVPPVRLYIFISFAVFFIPPILSHFDHSPKKQMGEETKQKPLVTVSKEEETDDIYLGDDSPLLEQLIKRLEKKKREDGGKEIIESYLHHFPKAIFLYMPIFAFWLWAFHNKKKWYYFDHGIYTLHYFSFILLSILLYLVSRWAVAQFQYELLPIVMFALLVYFIYYFFHSHRLIYGESKSVSRSKCIALFFINTFCMCIAIAVYFVVIVLISIL